MLAHANYHLTPEAFSLCGGYVIGANESLICVRAKQVAWTLQLPCRFYTIVCEVRTDMLVQHEIGFMKVTCDGDVKLSAITGLLDSFTLEHDRLRYRTLEGLDGVIRLY